MKGLILFFYRNDDVFINLFFILFFTGTVLNNTDNITIVLIFGIADAAFILYTLGRIFGIIKHFPRISIEDNNIIYRGFYRKSLFPIDKTEFTRSTSMGGAIDILKVYNPANNKQKSIFLTDLKPELRKELINIYDNN